MAWQQYPLMGFCPDLPVTTPGVFTMMRGAIATDRGIGSGPRIVESSSAAANSQSLGGALLAKTDATQELIVGTATKLYGFDLSTTLTDRSAGAYNASITNSWSITQFGNIAIAANLGDQLQQRTIGAAGNFASIGAHPVPQASIAICAGPVSAPFVVVFDYADGVNTDRDGWKCSAISDYTGWTAGTNQSATGRLLDDIPGPITAAIPYRDGIVAWKRTGMYIGTYVGQVAGINVIWSWQRVSSDVGCIGKNACVEANDVIYWADDCGIWMYDGSYPKQVPGKVQKFWTDRMTALAPSTADRNMYKVVWDKTKHLIWVLPGTYGGGTAIQLAGLNFNTVSGLWCEALSGAATTGGVINLSASSFLNDSTSALYVGELISARYFVSSTNIKVGTILYSSSGTEPAASQILGWAITDQVSSPVIKGVRPNWSIAPTSSGAVTWLTGNIYSFGAERDMQPGRISAVPSNTQAMFARAPGKLDGVFSAPAVATFDFFVASGNLWEITGINADIGAVGKS